MPIYEYKCPVGHSFEENFAIGDQPVTILCTECPEPELAYRIFSAPAIHFKGKGFYNTDYKSRATGPKEEKTPQETKEKADAHSNPPLDKKGSKEKGKEAQ